MEYIDFLGQNISVGDTIVYAVRNGSIAILKKATVAALSIKISYGKVTPSLRLKTEKSDRLVAFCSLDHCVVMKKKR